MRALPISLLLAVSAPLGAGELSLSQLDAKAILQGWGRPGMDKAVEGKPLTIGGVTFAKGIGTHAPGWMKLACHGQDVRFRAQVGVDDEVKDNAAEASLSFEVYADGRKVFDSGLMRYGQAAKAIDLDLKRVKTLLLRTTDGGDGLAYDHADWADARISFSGQAPVMVRADFRDQAGIEPLSDRHRAILAAAKEGAKPVFHGAFRVGIRPTTPFLHSLAVSGARPMTYAAKGLPEGLALDPKTGVLTGSLKQPGSFEATVIAMNAKGRASQKLVIACGDQLALTPPMGWNSYDAFGDAVNEAETMANAELVKARLQPLGYDTVVVDFRWYDPLADGLRNQNPEGVLIDANGLPYPAPNRFPSCDATKGLKPLADRIHAMGLKFGIHMMRGIPRKAVEKDLPIPGSSFRASQAALPESSPIRACPWNRDMWGVDATTEAGKAWYKALYTRFADWGVDYVKVDDLSFINGVYSAAEIEAIQDALHQGGRSIVLSLSPGETPIAQGEHVKAHANLWRAQGDFWDNWPALDNNLNRLPAWAPFAGPGHWPDGDMLPFGHVCIRNCDVGPDRWTKFTRDEQLTVMSAWALASSPLMLGMHLPDNDPWTWALIGNPEVLDVNQDVAGKSVRKVEVAGLGAELWVKDLADGSKAVGLFNRSGKDVEVTLAWKDAGLGEAPKVRDLWARKALKSAASLKATLPAHGCLMYVAR